MLRFQMDTGLHFPSVSFSVVIPKINYESKKVDSANTVFIRIYAGIRILSAGWLSVGTLAAKDMVTAKPDCK